MDTEVKEKEKKQIVRHKDVIEERKKLEKVCLMQRLFPNFVCPYVVTFS